jgi:hypothetical protein
MELKKHTLLLMQQLELLRLNSNQYLVSGTTFAASDKGIKLVYSDGTDIININNSLSNVAGNGFAVAMAIAL